MAVGVALHALDAVPEQGPSLLADRALGIVDYVRGMIKCMLLFGVQQPSFMIAHFITRTSISRC